MCFHWCNDNSWEEKEFLSTEINQIRIVLLDSRLGLWRFLIWCYLTPNPVAVLPVCVNDRWSCVVMWKVHFFPKRASGWAWSAWEPGYCSPARERRVASGASLAHNRRVRILSHAETISVCPPGTCVCVCLSVGLRSPPLAASDSTSLFKRDRSNLPNPALLHQFFLLRSLNFLFIYSQYIRLHI